MAKRTRAKKPDAAVSAEPEAAAVPAKEETAQIAVDFGDGHYQIVDAPGGSPRSITVVLNGVPYQHVDEYQGLWAYRAM